MRDYLYIWNDPVNQCIIASGIEFRQIADRVGLDGGLVLLSHGDSFLSKYIKRNSVTGFDYVPCACIPELAKIDIYSWGDFCWVDYVGDEFPSVSDHEIAELLFFAHTARSLDKIVMPSLNNRYMCYAHDDGWFLKLYYSSWDDIVALISLRYPQLDLVELQNGSNAYWVCGSSVEIEEKSLDIDAILNRRLRVS